MAYRGHVKNGMVVPDDGVKLPEGVEVRIDLVDSARREPDVEKAPTLYERLKPVIGRASGLPPDASTNVDHYLYGHPRR